MGICCCLGERILPGWENIPATGIVHSGGCVGEFFFYRLGVLPPDLESIPYSARNTWATRSQRSPSFWGQATRALPAPSMAACGSESEPEAIDTAASQPVLG